MDKSWPEAGGLMSYGTNISDTHRRVATYVDRKAPKPLWLAEEVVAWSLFAVVSTTTFTPLLTALINASSIRLSGKKYGFAMWMLFCADVIQSRNSRYDPKLPLTGELLTICA